MAVQTLCGLATRESLFLKHACTHRPPPSLHAIPLPPLLAGKWRCQAGQPRTSEQKAQHEE
eukprot:1653024-Prorocentrum_lima.AAC.1